MWILSFTCGAIFSSCGGGENDEPEGPNNNYESDYSSKILGIWYGCDDIEGFDLRFNSNGTVNVLIFDQLCSYKVEGNKLVVEKWTDLCGDILSIDENDMYLFCNNKYYRHFSRTDPNTGGDNGESGGGNNDDDSGDNKDNDSTKPPYNNYIHYRYYQKDYYHEISLVKQEVELASASTIHGWNYKYLNCYIGDSRKKVGFQFESTYYEDEYPPTTPWPAMEYNISSTSGSAVSHFPIARVFVYDDNMSRKTQYPTVGTGKIKYVGNKLIFDFTSEEKSSDYYVDLHFEGTLSY